MSDRRALLTVAASVQCWIGIVAASALAAHLVVGRSNPDRAPLASAASKPATPGVDEDPRVSLGRELFFDRRLSDPEGTSCASCHDPSQAYAGNNGSEIGTAQGSRPGHYARRNTPSVLYLRFVRKPQLVWEEDAERPELFGGFFWDGRARTVAALVREPLLNADEMGNRDLPQIVAKVRASAYADALRREFEDVFSSDEKTVEAISACLEAFLTSRPMSPFSSKFDDFICGRGALSPLERRGLALFDDLDRGACSACHRLDAHSDMPESSLFTDYGYDTIAVPRNRNLPDNRDPQHYDRGVCDRPDPRFHTEDAWFCGAFRTPSLRNVAKRKSFMHNGFFTKLRDVVAFYATRATDPARWYRDEAFDDLPAAYRDNVNAALPPYNQRAGELPQLSEADIDALVAFLETLSDREIPAVPAQ